VPDVRGDQVTFGVADRAELKVLPAALIATVLVIVVAACEPLATATPSLTPTVAVKSSALPTARATPTAVPVPSPAVADPDALYLLPRGSLKGQLVDAAGQRFEPGDNWDVRAIGDIGQYEPDGGVGIATNPDGSFYIERLAEMGWPIEIVSRSGEVVGTAHVEVQGGLQAFVEVAVAP
jgi:hypothetical protein